MNNTLDKKYRLPKVKKSSFQFIRNFQRKKWNFSQICWSLISFNYVFFCCCKNHLPHVSSLLITGKLSIRISLHSLQELSLNRCRWSRSSWISGCWWIPIAGHLLTICCAKWKTSLTQCLTGNRWCIIWITAFFSP